MKDQILQYLHSDRTFATAKKLYNRIPGGSASLRRMINMRGETEENHRQLNYELAKIAGIDERVMLAMLRRPMVTSEEEKKAAADPDGGSPDPSQLPEDFPHRDRLAKLKTPILTIQQIAEIDKLSSVKGIGAKMEKDILDYMATLDVAGLGKTNAPTATDSRRGYQLLTKQYPFLEKVSCPAEIRQLAQFSVATYDAYKQAHAALSRATTKEKMELYVREAVLNHIANRACHKELEHYMKYGKELGEHIIWQEKKIREEIEKMPGKELIKEFNNLQKSRNKLRARMKVEENEKLNAARQEKIDEKELRMKIINQRLDQI